MTTPIPSPPSIPFLGHLASIDKGLPLRSFYLLAQEYGEIYQLDLLNGKTIVINSQRLLAEVSDESRFIKKPFAHLLQVRNALGDALFTGNAPGDENWYIAHRLLMPAFSAHTVLGMFDDMTDIVTQLANKWERFGPAYVIEPAEDFTRLTLDAICLASMSYRLNSFYREDPHPFVKAMVDFLIECGLRSTRPALVQALMHSATVKYENDQRIMMDLVTEILDDRRKNPTEKKDLLNVMLNGRDKETGLTLSEHNIKQNLLTFLIAGHETTSGMLTFMTYYLVKNPEAMRKLREEIDTKIGSRPMTAADVNKLPYLIAVMREALRLGPSAPGRSVAALEDTTLLQGKYAVPKDLEVRCNIYSIHRDRSIWGEDAEEFRPERMLDGKFEALPPNAWQPFGYGARGCIGRPFAWQEVQMTMVTLLQKFDLVLHDPAYELELKQTLTIKPGNFFIHALPRAGRSHLLAVPSSVLLQSPVVPASNTAQSVAVSDDASGKQLLYVLYGSNTGSSESFAHRISQGASAHGFKPTLATLDSATEHVPTDGPVVIITASFEGQPADNAKHFIEWLSNLQAKELEGVKYTVFGCGNSDWKATFQRIPRLCDDEFSKHGATRLAPRGEADAGSAEFFESFDAWESSLWKALAQEYKSAADASEEDGLVVKTINAGTARAEILRQPDAALGTVAENRMLTASGVAVKRHIEFELPEGTTYRAGDYLAILPTNPERDIKRAIARFGLSPEQEVVLSSSGPNALPIDKPVSLFSLFQGYVELSQPATKRDLNILAGAENSEKSKAALEDLISHYHEKVFQKRLSVLAILEDNPDIKVSLSVFLQMLPSMRIRQYSISSSPLWNPQRVSLTISVLDAPSISGRDEVFLGVGSTYLAGLRVGDKVQLAVRKSNITFHPPDDPKIPLVMICAGSGLAPMRGFIQERAMQKKAGRDVGKCLLFFGCHSAQQDYLYHDTDLKEWAELGVVDLRPAFSRSPAESDGCKYVADRIWHDRADIVAANKEDARFYICGASKVAAGAKDALVSIIQDVRQCGDEEARERYQAIAVGRVASDIFE